jgi:nucleoside-diphosphate-sugar epimerase
MRILITGSTGFVGKNLVPVLLNENYQILEITRNIEKSISLFGEKTEKYQITEDQEALTSAINKFNPEIVIHLAAMLTSADDYETMQKLLNSNINFLCRILDALKETELKLFVNTGTFAEYYKGDGVFDPAYLYSATKTASRSFLDYYSKVYNFKQATIVPYTVYGGKDSQKKIIDIIYDSMSSVLPVDMSPGQQVLDFIHVDDVINVYIKIIKNTELLPKKINFQLGTGVGHTLKKLAEIIENLSHQKANINWGGKPYRKSDIMYAVANIQSLDDILDWQPNLSLKIGVERYLSKINSSNH